MQINVKIDSPELANAILALANAINKGSVTQVEQASHFVPALQVQQPQQQASPVQAPTTQHPVPAQQAPQQQAVPVASPAPVQQQQAPQPSAVPTTEQTYTMDQLAVAATQLMDAGRQQELLQLLNSFGVQALTMLPKEQYGAFATQLRAMGAKL